MKNRRIRSLSAGELPLVGGGGTSDISLEAEVTACPTPPPQVMFQNTRAAELIKKFFIGMGGAILVGTTVEFIFRGCGRVERYLFQVGPGDIP